MRFHELATGCWTVCEYRRGPATFSVGRGHLDTHRLIHWPEGLVKLPRRFGNKGWERKPVMVGILLQVGEGDQKECIEIQVIVLEAGHHLMFSLK